MAEPQPYVPGQTGTLADVVEQGPALGAVRPAGPDGFAPPPGGWDLLHAGRVQSRAYRMDFDEIMLRDGYAPIVDALGLGASENPVNFTVNSAGPQLYDWLTDRPLRDAQEEKIAGAIHARRAKEKNFLPGVPDDIEGLHAYFREQEAKKRQAAAGTIARSRGLGDALTVFAGGGIESFHDPVNIFTLPIGGGGKTLVQTVGREALANGILEALQLPSAAKNLDELGDHLTAGEAVGDVVTAGVFGGAFGGTVHIAGAHVPPLLFKAMPESVQRRWADRMKVGDGKGAPLLKDVLGDMDNRELAGFAKATIGDRMTPDERAASNVLEREQDLGEASPFEHGPAGDGAHQANLADALKSIIDGAPRETKGSLLASTSPVASRSPAPVAVPTHAGFDAQWAAIKGNEHGIGAHGEFLTSLKGAVGPAQVMPGTAPYAAKLAGLPFDERRYRTDAAYNEALGRAYYTEQLETFGDPAMAAAAYNAGPGNAAKGTGLRGALRRAAEHGEPGNWEAYLPHETQRYVEDFRRRTGAAAGDGRVAFDFSGEEEAAAFRGAVDQAERDAIAASRDREGLDVDAAGDRAHVAEVPVLKRDLFASDEDWADAQAAFHQSLNSDGDASGRVAAAEQVSGASEAQAAENAPGEAAGPFGPEYLDVADDWPAARARLVAEKTGVVPGVIDHPDIGPIDVPWGVAGTGKSDGYGLAKIEKYHPDVAADLPEIVRSMTVRARDPGRIHLTGPNHRGAVSLDWMGTPTNAWLLTAFAKDAEHLPKGAPPLPDDRRGSIGGRDGSPDRGAEGNIGETGPIDNAALKAFDDGGSGRADQVASLEHDYRAALADPEHAARTYEVGDAGQERRLTLAELLDEFDRDREAAAALRACAGGGE